VKKKRENNYYIDINVYKVDYSSEGSIPIIPVPPLYHLIRRVTNRFNLFISNSVVIDFRISYFTDTGFLDVSAAISRSGFSFLDSSV
jgi:hypothetical protein